MTHGDRWQDPWKVGERVMHRKTHIAGVVLRTLGENVVEVATEAGYMMCMGHTLKADPSAYGFQYGPVEVSRLGHVQTGGHGHTHVVRLTSDAGIEIEVSVSRTGRAVRVYRKDPGDSERRRLQ